MKVTRYRRPEDKLIIEVYPGPGGDDWMVACRGWRKKTRYRYESPELPIRKNRAKCQEDLDRFAEKMGWEAV